MTADDKQGLTYNKETKDETNLRVSMGGVAFTVIG